MPKTKSSVLKYIFRRPTLPEIVLSIILIVFCVPFFQSAIAILLLPYTYDLIGFLKFQDSLPQVTYFPILRQFPSLTLAWVPGFLIFCTALFLGKLVETDAKKAWKLTFIFLLTAPFLYQIFYYNTLAKQYLLWIGSDLSGQYLSINTIKGFIQNYFLFGYWPWTASLIALLVFKKSFYKLKLQNKSFKWVIVTTLCLLIPPLLYTGGMFIISRHSDDGLTQIKNQIDFTVYQPTYLPKYYRQEIKYKLFTVNNRQAIHSVIDINNYAVKNYEEHFGFISIRQFKTDPTATPGAYIPAVPATVSAQLISNPAAKNQTATIWAWSDVLVMTYTTPEDSVITLLSSYISLEELLKFSAGLKKY